MKRQENQPKKKHNCHPKEKTAHNVGNRNLSRPALSQKQQQQQQPRRHPASSRPYPQRQPPRPHPHNPHQPSQRRILALHGSRQTGSLFLGRLEQLQLRLWKEFGVDLVAPDAPFPHPENEQLRRWWRKHGEGQKERDYVGLDRSLQLLKRISDRGYSSQRKRDDIRNTLKDNGGMEFHDDDDQDGDHGYDVVGILGFSQGARLAYFVALLHCQNPTAWFPHLSFVILVAGYDEPLPHPFSFPLAFPQVGGFTTHHHEQDQDTVKSTLAVPSLHVWGRADPLIAPHQSQALTRHFFEPSIYVHDGKHYVPSKANDIQTMVNFIQKSMFLIQTEPGSTSAAQDGGAEENPQRKAENKGDIVTFDNSLQSPPNMNQKDISVMNTCTAVEKDDGSNAFPIPVSPQIRQAKSMMLQDIPFALQQSPDEETVAIQREEVFALQAIFPDELKLISSTTHPDDQDHQVFEFPIIYDLQIGSSTEDDGAKKSSRSTSSLVLRVMYPHNYPMKFIPQFRWMHPTGSQRLSIDKEETLSRILNETATANLGMPSIMSCIQAINDYLETCTVSAINTETSSEKNDNYLALGISNTLGDYNDHIEQGRKDDEEEDDHSEEEQQKATNKVPGVFHLPSSSAEEIQKSNIEGLRIAEQLLRESANSEQHYQRFSRNSTKKNASFWTYTIGLVGKPSAGKSTFFNAATAFSRQRGDHGDSEWGGASMAPHPFTTIDPNIGYCLVPAPSGSCPEDDITELHLKSGYGSTHGRDPMGQRFLPVLLKDVAGLVPGAYQGRGRGNQFLNDLTDATVLVHVVDASGTADAEGNKTACTGNDEEWALTNPLEDLCWIRNELVEWVYSNLLAKWGTVVRKGREKLSGMFSGYGQTNAVIQTVFSAVERFVLEQHRRDRCLDKISQWNQADVHRVVSAFLGVRFPMALALNKCDLPSSQRYVDDILGALPIHGAHVGTKMSAHREMKFVKHHLRRGHVKQEMEEDASAPSGVWQCLTSAMMLCAPVLIFPVSDMATYAPLPGLAKNALSNPSLPSKEMIACICAAGGIAPSCWDSDQESYISPSKENMVDTKLQDVLLMKQGSTVFDAFLTLKKLGAMSGEFVRAEACANIGDKAKPLPKNEILGKKNRIIKIMSNKRSVWQS